MSIVNDIKFAYNKATVVEKIIYITILFFLLTALFTSVFVQWFALPSNLDSFISKPWTLVSYAFIHERLLHVLSNIIVLYYIGNLFLDFYSEKQFLHAYFSSILIGGVAFLGYYYLSNQVGAPLGGASAAVSAIFVAIATKIPRYALQLRFIGSVEIWVLAAIWVVLSILQLVAIDKGSAIAHLSGAAFGYLYAKQAIKGTSTGKGFDTLSSYFKGVFTSKKRTTLKTVHKSSTRKPIDEYSKTKQRQIDDILDKISKSGYDSLSKEEKEFLFRAGKK